MSIKVQVQKYPRAVTVTKTLESGISVQHTAVAKEDESFEELEITANKLCDRDIEFVLDLTLSADDDESVVSADEQSAE